jgi:FkbM family methyltransferase
LSYKRTLIRLLDRPGGRFLLSKIATHLLQRAGNQGVEVAYLNGLWTRRVGSDLFPDSHRFDYTQSDFNSWKRQLDQYIADTEDLWLQHYRPKEGDVIVDVGAGRGEDTVAFSRAVGKTGRVIAIEAHPVSFAMLRNFCRLHRLANVTPLQLALMDRPGTAHVVNSQSSWTENTVVFDQASPGAEVRAATLNEVWREQGLSDIAFLKMNIEGAERLALQGMQAVMLSIRHICVACHDFRAEMGHGEQFRTRSFTEQFLTRYGFTLASRTDDPREGVCDHVFGLRP